MKILSIPIESLTLKETIKLIKNCIDKNHFTQHVVVNAGKIVAMQKDEALRKSVLEADIINADGMAVVWASRFLGKALPERVAGIDLMLKLVEMAHEEGYKCFFLGAKEEVVKKVVEVFKEKYSEKIIAGYRNGYFNEEEEEEVVKQIANSGAHMLFVAISSPKKEVFVNKYKDIMNVPFVMGVGGSFDVVAGITKRAPLWMQKIGMEWFYRFIQEPRRMWKRYLIGNSKFIWLVLKEKFKSGRGQK
ncbi:WecB/TagA/CpsF family glycosyltransferase [Thermophagus sp. OGC60D27]|uniref:WecB/TagA/CpsF family glycosyltransferase n=1 Tax=Thermophagus sp. OGC60D27 TaxID=3458415 RepID=UPI00403795E6